MKRLNDKERKVFLVYGVVVLFLWISTCSIVFHMFKGSTLAEIGKDRGISLIIGFMAMAYFLYRFPFLRPQLSVNNKRVLAIRIVQFILGAVMIMAAGPMIIELLLADMRPIVLFNCLITFVCAGIINLVLEKILLPLAK